MCGICGELSLAGAPIHAADIKAMASAIGHRGPDGRGFHCEGPVGFGHLRLSIIDLSDTGRQPMTSEDGSMWITFNGEIYNYQEIANELEAEGVRFRGRGDTEVAVNAIRRWGVKSAVRRFIGMFAFAVWDTREQRLTLVRDRAGIKPLFYWTDGKRVLFGSETRALMAHSAFRRALDPVGVGQFFVTGMSIGEHTALEGVKRVLPGHTVSVTADGRWTTDRYWSLDDVTRSKAPRTMDDAADELEALLDSAVGYRLVSDVPVANFLSGGIDSSLVAAILRRKLGADVTHITVGFREGAFDESEKARRVAADLGLRHEVHYIEPADAAAGLDRFVEVFDEPFGDTSGIPTALLSRVARESVKVALSADGGDEQFCGYESYARYATAWNRIRHVPAPMRRVAASVARMLPLRALAGASSGAGGLRPQMYARVDKALRIASVGSQPELIRMMFEKAWRWNEASPARIAADGALFDRTVLSDASMAAIDDDLLGSMMRADYAVFLRDDVLTKVDRASMHVSLEARDPLLDHRIAEFAFAMPTCLSYAGGEHKAILKHLLRRWVSEEIVSSPKRGFSIPLYAWMRDTWKSQVLERLSDAEVRRVGVLNPLSVRREIEAFYRYPGRSAERIWMLLNFQMWAARWFVK